MAVELTVELLLWMEARGAEVIWVNGAEDECWRVYYVVPGSPHQHFASGDSNTAAISAAMAQDETWPDETPMGPAREWWERNGKTPRMRLL